MSTNNTSDLVEFNNDNNSSTKDTRQQLKNKIVEITDNSIKLLIYNDRLYKCRYLMSKLSKRIPPLNTPFIQQKIINLTKFLLSMADDEDIDRDASFARDGNVVLSMHIHDNNSINLNIREIECVDDMKDIPIDRYKYTFIIQVL